MRSAAVRLVRGPLSARPWRATAYLASYLPVGLACCVVTLTVLVTAVLTNVTWLGLPLLLGATEIVRGCAGLERQRARLFGDAITSGYRPTPGGLFGQVRTRLTDPATWRDTGFLTLLFPPLLVLDVVALAVWLVCLAGIALPAWYWTIPNSWHDGTTEYGVLLGVPTPAGRTGIWIGSLPSALAASAASLLLAPLAATLLTGAAWLHHRVARLLLGPHTDPLAEARRVLGAPGPLTAPPRPEGVTPWPVKR